MGLSLGTVTSYNGNLASGDSHSVTVDASANLILVWITERFTNANTTACTYGGQALTQLLQVSNSTIDCVSLWYLVSPPTGANNLVLTKANSGATVVGVEPYIGADTGTPFDTQGGGGALYVSATGNPGANDTLTVSSSATGIVSDGVGVTTDVDETLTVGGSQTQQFQARPTQSGGAQAIRGAGSTLAGAASVSMVWTFTSSGYAHAAVSVRASSGTGGGGAFPTTGLLTSFTGANENPLSESAAWTAAKITTGSTSQFQRVSNTATSPSGSARQPYATVYGADQESFVTVTTVPTTSNNGAGVWLRVTNEGTASVNGYLCVWIAGGGGTQGFQLYKVISGTFIQLGASVATAMVNGDKIGGSAVGTAIKVYHFTGGAWVNRISLTDSAVTGAGKIGIEADDTVVVLDDFGGGSVASSAGGHRGLLLGVG